MSHEPISISGTWLTVRAFRPMPAESLRGDHAGTRRRPGAAVLAWLALCDHVHPLARRAIYLEELSRYEGFLRP